MRLRQPLPVVLGGFVVVVAILVALYVALSGSDDEQQLTAEEQAGKQVFVQHCSTCHTLADARAVGKTGPNLDELRPPRELVVSAVEQGRSRGNGSMPADLVQGEQVTEVAAYVSAVAGQPKD